MEMTTAKPMSHKMGIAVFCNSWLMITRFSFKKISKKAALDEDLAVEDVGLLKKSYFKLVKLYQRTSLAARGKTL